MTKELKTLKDKREFIKEGDGKVNFDGYWVYPEEDIKEFIRLELILIEKLHLFKLTWKEFIEEREKLSGDLK